MKMEEHTVKKEKMFRKILERIITYKRILKSTFTSDTFTVRSDIDRTECKNETTYTNAYEIFITENLTNDKILKGLKLQVTEELSALRVIPFQ